MAKPEISEFDSVDPAPASESLSVSTLRLTICNEDERMFQRMRALFALRNIGGNDSDESLASGFNSKSPNSSLSCNNVGRERLNKDLISAINSRGEIGLVM